MALAISEMNLYNLDKLSDEQIAHIAKDYIRLTKYGYHDAHSLILHIMNNSFATSGAKWSDYAEKKICLEFAKRLAGKEAGKEKGD